ncbi:hypothetical protein GH714_039910 [Hevea brasiliensis]|uniref:GATA-type domain-containing protein n=1 Tax=Hevea brasiliensis TaxID=3981 RepID=A0A6A6M3M7_HEVBR|nr:hypothetical protein GH714_039910 [Hevea brasiliensis]
MSAAQGSENEDMSSRSTEGEHQQKKTCADCGTSKTPLWRGGPAGPKVVIADRSAIRALIKKQKKKRDSLGLNRGANEKKAKKGNNHHSSSNRLRDGLKHRLLALGREVLMQRSTVEKQRRKLGEEEQAAVLLMALSYGSVYA